MRADLFLVKKGLVPSRARAQELIDQGRVFIKGAGARRLIMKSSETVLSDQCEIEIEDSLTLKFVSRGGVKLAGALARTGLLVKDLTVLDIGISTGGFTDCVLQAGARRVVGIDVGHGQLASVLRTDPRVTLFEGVNARELGSIETQIVSANGGSKFDLVLCDVSFISLNLVMPEWLPFLSDAGRCLVLVKPQFEVGRQNLGKNGIVKDPLLHREVEDKIRRACATARLRVEDYFASSIEGSDGNIEFFLFARAITKVDDRDCFDDGDHRMPKPQNTR